MSRHHAPLAAAALLACLAAPVLAKADEARFTHLCDISAAALLDETTLIAANDEENALFTFPTNGGDPIARRNLADLLSIPQNAKEIDFEAAARDANRIWWVGSHQADKPRRRMIFATNIPNADLGNLRIVVPPADLTRILQTQPDAATLWHPTTWLEDPEDGGINIEAAAISAGGHLLLGFRAPLDGPGGTSGKAIVIELTFGASFAHAKTHRLDLSGLGLRGMVRDGDGYFLIAGALDGGGRSRLFRWTPGTTPEPLPHPAFDRFNPEALVLLPDHLLVFSDDGTQRRLTEAGKRTTCKKLAAKGNGGDGEIYTRARRIPVQ